MHKPNGRENLRTLNCHGFPLGVVCLRCENRSLIPLKNLNAYSGNMKSVHAVRLI
jgi:hypothetical protein